MASNIYNSFKIKGYDSSTKINLASGGDTLKVALCTSSYTPSLAHDFFDDITNEITGSGYTAGGATLGSQTYTLSTNTAVFTGANTTWATSTITARYAIIYKSTGVASTSPLLGYIDFGSDRTSDGGTFQITWNASGIINIT